MRNRQKVTDSSWKETVTEFKKKKKKTLIQPEDAVLRKQTALFGKWWAVWDLVKSVIHKRYCCLSAAACVPSFLPSVLPSFLSPFLPSFLPSRAPIPIYLALRLWEALTFFFLPLVYHKKISQSHAHLKSGTIQGRVGGRDRNREDTLKQ